MKLRLKKIYNYVAYGIIGILGLLILLFFATQTPVFKNWLRKKIIKSVNQNSQYELKIEKLNGNLFSDLNLKNVNIKANQQRLLNVNGIAVKYNIFSLINKKIDITELTLTRPGLNIRNRNNLQNATKNNNFPGKINSPKSGSNYKVTINELLISDASLTLPEKGNNVPSLIRNINLKGSLNYGNQQSYFILDDLNCKSSNPEYTLQTASFKINKKNKSYYLNNLNIETENNQIKGQANFQQLNNTDISFKITTAPLNFREFKFLSDANTPEVNPKVTLKGDYHQDSLNINLTAMDSNQSIDINITANRTGELLQGKLNNNISYNISSKIRNIEVEEWLNNKNLIFHLNGDISWTGQGIRKEELKAEFQGDFFESNVNGNKLKKLAISGSYYDKRLSSQLSLQSQGGKINASGKIIDIWQSPHYKLDFSTKDLNLQSITNQKIFRTTINMEGSIQGEGTDYRKTDGQMKLNINTSSISGLTLKNVSSHITFDNSKYRINNFEVESDVANIDLQGKINLNAISNLKIAADIKDLSPVEQYLPIDSIRAAGTTTAHLVGNTDSMDASAQFNLNSLQYHNSKIDSISGELSFQWNNNIKNIETKFTANNLQSSGILFDKIGLTGQYQNDSANIDLEVSKKNRHLNLKSKVALDSITEITLSGITLDIFDYKWRDTGKNAKVQLKGNNYKIDNFHLVEQTSTPEQSILAQGIISQKGHHDFNINLTNISSQTINSIRKMPGDVEGELDLGLSLKGTTRQPIITSNLKLDNGKLNKFTFNNFQGNFNYSQDKLNWNFLLQADQTKNIGINGNANFNLSDIVKNKDIDFNSIPFDLKIDTDNFPLSIARAGNIPIKKIKGQGKCQINLFGTLGEPEIRGDFTLQNASLNIPKYGINYKNIGINLELNNNSLKVDNFNIKRERGFFNLSSSIQFNSTPFFSEVQNIDLSFNTSKFYLSKHPDHQIQITGRGYIKKEAEQPEFGGNLKILRSSINLTALTGKKSKGHQADGLNKPILVQAQKKNKPLNDTTEVKNIDRGANQKINLGFQDFYNKLKGEYKIEIPRNTWIRNSNLKSEVSGKLNLIKEGLKLKIFGDINIVRGYYDFLGRRFRIKSGLVTFTGSDEVNPRINLIAEYTFRDARQNKKHLTLKLKGPARQPEIQFLLDDEKINEGDALAYIMFGKSIGDLSTGQQNEIEENIGVNNQSSLAKNLAANYLSAEISKLLSKQLNLDYIDIKSEDQWQSASLIIGKYLTTNLFISYQKGVGVSGESNNLSETVKLEYQLSKFLFLQLMGHSKYGGFDVLFKYQQD